MKIGPVLAATCLLILAAVGVFYLTRPATQSAAAKQAEEESNEPKPSPTGPHPRAVTPDRIYDFDAMMVNETLTHEFVLRNEGEAPLILGKPVTTCKCTVPSEVNSGIPPGEERKITLEWTPKAAQEEFSQEARFKTNDPVSPEISFVVMGRVDQLLRIEPEETWRIGDVSGEEPHDVKGFIYSTVRDKFNITEASTANPLVTVRTEPMTKEQLEERSAKAGYQIVATLSPELPIGRINESITLKTDLGDEDHAKLSIDMLGTRRGPIQVVPLPGVKWNAEAMALDLGRFPTGTGKSAEVWLFVSGLPEGEEFRFEKVDISVPYFEVDLQKDESFKGKGTQRYRLKFRVSMNCPVAVHYGKRAVRVVAQTSHPDAKEMKFFVEFVTTDANPRDKVVNTLGR